MYRPQDQTEDFIGAKELILGTEKVKLNSTHRKRVTALKSSHVYFQKGMNTGRASLGRSDVIIIALNNQSMKKPL